MPAASGSGRCSCCWRPSSAPSGGPRGGEGRRRGRAHPRGHPAPRRRDGRGRAPAGSSTANARWDNSVAILSGDWLFARASDLVADLGAEAVRIQARTFGRLVEGQIRETLGVGEGQDPLTHYLSVVADKTGSLIATSALFGARYAGASEEVQESLRAFGEEIGVAFQLADDILDIASESGQSGKTPGTDLREGVPTLPVLIFRAQADPRTRRTPVCSSSSSPTCPTTHAWAETLDLLRAHPAFRQAEDDVRRRPPTPASSSRPSPTGSARDALDSLCDLVVSLQPIAVGRVG